MLFAGVQGHVWCGNEWPSSVRRAVRTSTPHAECAAGMRRMKPKVSGKRQKRPRGICMFLPLQVQLARSNSQHVIPPPPPPPPPPSPKGALKSAHFVWPVGAAKLAKGEKQGPGPESPFIGPPWCYFRPAFATAARFGGVPRPTGCTSFDVAQVLWSPSQGLFVSCLGIGRTALRGVAHRARGCLMSHVATPAEAVATHLA